MTQSIDSKMTDSERIAEIEEYHRRYFPVPNISLHVEDLLRIVHDQRTELASVIRDQRAELVQARQAISNMRNALDGVCALKRAMTDIPKCEPDMLRLELRYLPTKPGAMGERTIVLAYCGADVSGMIEKLGMLADHAAMRLAEFGVDARDIV